MRKTLLVILLYLIWRLARRIERNQYQTLRALLVLHADARVIADLTAPDSAEETNREHE